MKKVCILKGSLAAKGGLEKYCLRVAQALSKRGDDVHLLGFGALNGSDNTFKVHAVCRQYPLSLLQLTCFDRACKKYIEQEAPDSILGFFRNRCTQTHYRAGNGCHRAYLERRKAVDPFWKRYSFTWNPLHRFILDCEKKTFESPHLQHLIVNSHLVRREIESFYPAVSPSKITVIHNGVEWKDLQIPFDSSFENYSSHCRDLGVKQESFKLLFIGHEWRRKGLTLLLQAMAALPSYIELMVVGHDRERHEFYRLRESLGLTRRVHFYGRRADTSTFYTVADVCVIPSTYDPFANVTVEALAMGCFVVSSADNGGAEVLQVNSTGLIFRDLLDPAELIAAIQKSCQFPKTRARAALIRQSVAYLDFQNQLDQLIGLI